MGKEVPYKPEKICDGCGKAGAFDFYGDYLCETCCGLDDLDDIDEEDLKSEDIFE